ncbi:hypothetical protein [Xanthomonas hortorum]|uniref:Secreted protein n=1 Tax=Xanthomonas hortorum pv. pelargonii TaxID=453602 RepID=A0A6V7DYX9_9XANT|nr:hypothetical protein [Xanthomonas hortorum]MCE4355431.1 hypothetical protein [Xanthomonas hortorum pv. pelargonii]MCM5525179.1 hypothetical protein [Xanthomonas hortorum pv. pelargonii]MCM5537746.1 hypothetical protein [Xanthomonas hortorum pv. pelargonii]MCM5541870.1 hypothetical protein [Xanthomonas hortorum pv. pelargonii]MCM5545304.1 hypothetical protein [Xanthomonas hortorum pv. pelargonii]
MQTIAFMMPVTLLKRLMLLALFCSASVANAAASRGPENSTLHIGLRLLSGCELRTTPPRASCSRGTPMAIAQPARAAETPAITPAIGSTGQDASALAGPAPATAARITTIAF